MGYGQIDKFFAQHYPLQGGDGHNPVFLHPEDPGIGVDRLSTLWRRRNVEACDVLLERLRKFNPEGR